MTLFGALAGGALGAIGGAIGASKDTSRRRTNRFRGQRVIGTMEGLLRQGFGQQEQGLFSQLSALQEGFGAAQDHMSNASAAARQDVLDINEGLLGRLNAQNAGSQFRSTGFGNAQRGIAADTTRRLLQISSAQSQAQASLIARSTLAQAQVLNNIANFYGVSGQALAGNERLRFDLFTQGGSNQAGGSGVDLGGLGSLLGDLGGFFANGPSVGGFFGGGGGGEPATRGLDI